MCGIAGIISLKGEANVSVEALIRMVQKMHHRGPDDEGFLLANKAECKAYWGDDTPYAPGELRLLSHSPKGHIKDKLHAACTLAFGHRRLSIIDLSIMGHQPMPDEDGRYWLVYNGEIYNFRELKNELSRVGAIFKTGSDSELLIQAYIHWGRQCVEHFNGMFAFAIYDSHEQSVFIARDRIGIKPFFYTVQNGQFIFASDIKTIIASGLYQPKVNWEGIWHLFSYGVTPRPATAFDGVFSLETAHWMKITPDGKIIKQQYWKLPVGTVDYSLTEEQAAEMIEAQLLKSVGYTLVSDVEVATFMSGGVDSSLVTSMANKITPGIRAFTLYYEDKYNKEFNELEQAEETARMNHIEHISKLIYSSEVYESMDDIVLLHEEPYYSVSTPYVISKLVAQYGVKVILNGIGGDELFAGYDYNRHISYWNISRLLKPFMKFVPYNINKPADYAKKLSQTDSFEGFYTFSHSSFSDGLKAQLFKNIGQFEPSEHLIKRIYDPHVKFDDHIEALSYYDMLIYIGAHHVYRLDQFTMNFSIEGRFPMLDHEFVEAAYKIPSSMKQKGKTGKYILKKVASKYISPASITMPKKGFGMPLKYWLNKELKHITQPALDNLLKRNVLNLNRQMLDKMNANQQWTLVMLELWMEKLVGS